MRRVLVTTADSYEERSFRSSVIRSDSGANADNSRSPDTVARKAVTVHPTAEFRFSSQTHLRVQRAFGDSSRI